MHYSRIIAISGLIIFGMLSRYLPHPPNFTALNSIALLTACFLGSSLTISLMVVWAAMFLSDLIFGLHSTLPFVYLSFGLIVLLGHRLRANQSVRGLPFFLSATSLLFFAVTNFGVWLTDSLYEKTLSGLGLCYLAAVPFLANQVFGDLIYGMAMFGSFVLAEKYFPSIQEQKGVA